MNLLVQPVGQSYSTENESDIAEMSLGPSGLRVVVESFSSKFERVWVEYHFEAPRGFRFLDEGDLVRYWESKAFSAAYHLFEIKSGGWKEQELQVPGMLSVTDSVGTFREWFIGTTNACLNVLSVNPPLTRELR